SYATANGTAFTVHLSRVIFEHGGEGSRDAAPLPRVSDLTNAQGVIPHFGWVWWLLGVLPLPKSRRWRAPRIGWFPLTLDLLPGAPASYRRVRAWLQRRGTVWRRLVAGPRRRRPGRDGDCPSGPLPIRRSRGP